MGITVGSPALPSAVFGGGTRRGEHIQCEVLHIYMAFLVTPHLNNEKPMKGH